MWLLTTVLTQIHTITLVLPSWSFSEAIEYLPKWYLFFHFSLSTHFTLRSYCVTPPTLHKLPVWNKAHFWNKPIKTRDDWTVKNKYQKRKGRTTFPRDWLRRFPGNRQKTGDCEAARREVTPLAATLPASPVSTWLAAGLETSPSKSKPRGGCCDPHHWKLWESISWSSLALNSACEVAWVWVTTLFHKGKPYFLPSLSPPKHQTQTVVVETELGNSGQLLHCCYWDYRKKTWIINNIIHEPHDVTVAALGIGPRAKRVMHYSLISVYPLGLTAETQGSLRQTLWRDQGKHCMVNWCSGYCPYLGEWGALALGTHSGLWMQIHPGTERLGYWIHWPIPTYPFLHWLYPKEQNHTCFGMHSGLLLNS